jgi:phosphomannomutase
MIDSVHAEAERWLAGEPDADIRTELEALLAGPADELTQRFDGRLQFGTAGLRAAVGAGPQRMNRLVVRQAAAGLAAYLLATDPRARERGVIIGYDARRKSDLFALDTACVMAASGIRAMLFDQVVPTPVLAWSITEIDAAAGVVVTSATAPRSCHHTTSASRRRSTRSTRWPSTSRRVTTRSSSRSVPS